MTILITLINFFIGTRIYRSFADKNFGEAIGWIIGSCIFCFVGCIYEYHLIGG